MVDYTPHNRPSEQGRRPYEHVRDPAVVKTGNTGVMAAVVLFVLLAVAAFVFWTADDYEAVNATIPAAESGAQINEQAAPAGDAARPVPAPDAPLIAPDAAAPAAPDTTASPAPATNG